MPLAEDPLFFGSPKFTIYKNQNARATDNQKFVQDFREGVYVNYWQFFFFLTNEYG